MSEDVKFEGTAIDGVEAKELDKFRDDRGWLSQIWRSDSSFAAEMAYISTTWPGISRGPHEHVDQTDLFIFPGVGEFEFRMWDNREGSKTHGAHMRFTIRHDEVIKVLVPVGVVHGYKCVGHHNGLVLNLPDRLYGGEMQAETVDEIRHEDKDSPYSME